MRLKTDLCRDKCSEGKIVGLQGSSSEAYLKTYACVLLALLIPAHPTSDGAQGFSQSRLQMLPTCPSHPARPKQ